MLKSPMPPVYVPRHQVVKAKSFPAKRRVHSSWIGQRTCVHQRQALGNPGCHEPTMIGDALCNTHVCSFLEVRYTWVYHIIIIMDHVLAWVYHSEFLIMKSSPTFWLVNPLLIHYSFTTSSSTKNAPAPREHRWHPRYSSATPVAWKVASAIAAPWRPLWWRWAARVGPPAWIRTTRIWRCLSWDVKL